MGCESQQQQNVNIWIILEPKKSWAENFRMVDIGINAWSSLFDNLKINLILQDYLKSVWKTVIIRKTAAANQRKAGNQWENRNILIGENNLRISKDRED